MRMNSWVGTRPPWRTLAVNLPKHLGPSTQPCAPQPIPAIHWHVTGHSVASHPRQWLADSHLRSRRNLSELCPNMATSRRVRRMVAKVFLAWPGWWAAVVAIGNALHLENFRGDSTQLDCSLVGRHQTGKRHSTFGGHRQVSTQCEPTAQVGATSGSITLPSLKHSEYKT